MIIEDGRLDDLALCEAIMELRRLLTITNPFDAVYRDYVAEYNRLCEEYHRRGLDIE